MTNKKKTQVIAVANFKGGVSKTSTSLALASMMASDGKRVLLVDLDAQANATIASGVEVDPTHTLYETLVDNKPLPVHKVTLSNEVYYDIVPSDLKMAWIDIRMSTAIAREKLLQDALAPVMDNYDVILLDCPPSLALITQCAFKAATDVLIPLTPDSFAIEGLKMVIVFFNEMRAKINPELHLMGMLLTQYERNTLSKSAEEIVRNAFGQYLFDTKIRKNVAVGKSQAAKKDLLSTMPDSNAANDYKSFYQEILNKSLA